MKIAHSETIPQPDPESDHASLPVTNPPSSESEQELVHLLCHEPENAFTCVGGHRQCLAMRIRCVAAAALRPPCSNRGRDLAAARHVGKETTLWGQTDRTLTRREKGVWQSQAIRDCQLDPNGYSDQSFEKPDPWRNRYSEADGSWHGNP